jgi:hypothetical protein
MYSKSKFNSGTCLPFSKKSEKSGFTKKSNIPISKLKQEINTKALNKAVDSFCPDDKGKSAFRSPFNQKKLTAPARNTKVSNSPMADCESVDLAKTIPVRINVPYLTIWKS